MLFGNLVWQSCAGFTGKQQGRSPGISVQYDKQLYRDKRPASQLDHLTEDMNVRAGAAPKLRAKGAGTRYLVPFGLQLARSIETRDDHWVAAIALFTELNEIMRYMSDAYDSDLEAVVRRLWRICALAVDLEKARGCVRQSSGLAYETQVAPRYV
jgi:hypothetical protein